MQKDLYPETVLLHLKKGELSPYYLFYGDNEFQKARIIDELRKSLIEEELRQFNFRIIYGDELSDISPILEFARSSPFMSKMKLLVVRSTEKIKVSLLERLLDYLKNPSSSACIIFSAKKPDFENGFFKYIKEKGKAVNFRQFNEQQALSWIKSKAKDMGMEIEDEACYLLYQSVGNNLDELSSELEKLLCYGKRRIGIEEVKEIVSSSRDFTIFELIDSLFARNLSETLKILKSYMEREGKDKALATVGMIIRQLRLIQEAKDIVKKGGDVKKIEKELQIHSFLAKKIFEQSKHWNEKEIDNAFSQLYRADSLIKSTSISPQLILEQVIIEMCS